MQRNCSVPKLLITDNYRRKDVNSDIEYVRIVTWLPRTTAKHQPLDIFLIGYCKISYRALLLRATIKTVEARKEDQINTPKIRGFHEIRDGQLPHVRDAMDIFNESWRQTKRATIIKCWMKSECLDEEKAQKCESIFKELQNSEDPFIDLTNMNEDADNEREAVVDFTTCRTVMGELNRIAADNNSVNSDPLHDVLQQVDGIVQVAEFMAIMNSSAPFDEDPSRSQLANSYLQSMFDESRGDDIDINEVNGLL